MLRLRVTKAFKKDLRKAVKIPKRNTSLLKELIENHLLIYGSVPDSYSPHPLIGNWYPHMECHIQPDFLLIWRIERDDKELVLVRCGSHSELFD